MRIHSYESNKSWNPSQTQVKTKTKNQPFPVQTQEDNESEFSNESREYKGIPSGAMMANIQKSVELNHNNSIVTPIQPKLNIDTHNDKYKQEADNVAQTINIPTLSTNEINHSLQKKPISFLQRQEESSEELQTKGIDLKAPNIQADFESSLNGAKSGGSSLDSVFRAKVEPEMNADFSGVKVHTDSTADTLSKSIQAKAFTTGNDIFFKQGEYNPNSKSGQELLTHELTHTIQQGSSQQIQAKQNSSSIQPFTQDIIQRTLNQNQINRLKNRLGVNKYKKVVSAELGEYFITLDNKQLNYYKLMQNTIFDEIINGLKESSLSNLGVTTANFGQVADLLGAAIETGEDAATILSNLPSFLGSASNMIGSGVDAGIEGVGGGIGGIKDTIEGGMSIKDQSKYVEGGMSLVSGLSGIASLVPGVPDAVGIAGAGAKSLGGVTKMANTKINRNAINKLKSDSNANPTFIEALKVLDDSIGYFEGAQQAVLGGIEGAGSFFGGSYGKWGTSLFSKGVETLPSLAMYTGRAIGSTMTSQINSNAQVQEQEKQDKLAQKTKMRRAVLATVNTPDLIGSLHRLAVLIDSDFAKEIDMIVETLDSNEQNAIKQSIKNKNTWNPS